MNNENKENKALVNINEQGLFYKIKKFFKNIFGVKEEQNYSTNYVVEEERQPIETKKSFSETIKIVEDEETKLLQLQKKYRSGEIKESELSEEQIKSLCNLYDRQIENLEKSNQKRKEKILLYRRKLQTNN